MRPYAFLCLAAILIPGPAAAISPDELRDLLLSDPGADGVSVTLGGQRREGDTLILQDVIARVSDGRSSLSQAVAELRLRDLGGGRVEMTASPEASLVGRIGEGELTGTVWQAGLRVLFEGPASFPDVRVALDRLEADLTLAARGSAPRQATMQATLEDLAAAVRLDDGLPAETTLTLGRLAAKAGFTEAGLSGAFEVTLAELALGHRLVLPADLRAAIAAGPQGADAIRDFGILGGASATLSLGVGAVAVEARGRDDEGFRLDASARSDGVRATLAAQAAEGPVAPGTLPALGLDLSLAIRPGQTRIAMADPRGGEALDLATRTAGATATLAAGVGSGLGPADFEAGPPRGLSVRLALDETAGASELAVSGPGTPALSSRSRHEGARFEVALGETGLRSALALMGIDYALTVPELPGPVGVSSPEIALSFSLPVHRDPGPQPADLRVDLRDLRLSEALWSAFDPQALLPRDPIRVTLDAGALLTVIGNLFDPAARDTTPFRADRATLRALVLSGLGASVTGSGEAVLRYPAGPDQPEPAGAFQFRATGLYALMRRVQALGLVSDDALTGLRLGLATIAKPAGDDELTSDIRLGPGGRVVLNGLTVK